RGITARAFQRSFLVAEGIEVSGAALEHGMLFIVLACPKLETVVRRIDIRTSSDHGGGERDRKETRYE
ncbi:MAG TPA: hypothetical protein VGI20_00105, partial [Rhizomicrobium sp.]